MQALHVYEVDHFRYLVVEARPCERIGDQDSKYIAPHTH